jgi:hypothetical protein
MPSPFCTDLDLLHWEPQIFKDAAFISQTLLSTTGDLSDTTLTLGAGLIESAELSGGEIVCVGGTVDGCFPIVSIDSATQLTVSVLYDKLFETPSEPVRAAASATGVPVVIRTFWPQRTMVSALFLNLLGLESDQHSAVLNPDALRRACVMGTLQMVYSAMSAASPDIAAHAVRADLYERLYRRALRRARVELDLNNDGQPDCRRDLATIPLVRK